MQSLKSKGQLHRRNYGQSTLIGALKVVVITCGAVGNVYAQAPAEQVPAVPITPVLTFRSVFSNYKMMTDEPVGNWRDLNDAVGRIGGWRAYLKEAQQVDSKPRADDPLMKGPEVHPQTQPSPQPQPQPQPTAKPSAPEPAVRPHQHGAK